MIEEKKPEATITETENKHDPGTSKSKEGQDSTACRCKEAQGKHITDFIKVMIDDLAFWRRMK